MGFDVSDAECPFARAGKVFAILQTNLNHAVETFRLVGVSYIDSHVSYTRSRMVLEGRTLHCVRNLLRCEFVEVVG